MHHILLLAPLILCSKYTGMLLKDCRYIYKSYMAHGGFINKSGVQLSVMWGFSQPNCWLTELLPSNQLICCWGRFDYALNL